MNRDDSIKENQKNEDQYAQRKIVEKHIASLNTTSAHQYIKW
jgi:hypothetical protein